VLVFQRPNMLLLVRFTRRVVVRSSTSTERKDATKNRKWALKVARLEERGFENCESIVVQRKATKLLSSSALTVSVKGS